MLKKILKVLGVLIAAIVISAGGLIAWLSATEYAPEAVESAETIGNAAEKPLAAESTIKFLTFNTGYAGLGEEADFFMDGGKNTRTGDESTVAKNMTGIKEIIADSGADICLLQEVDADSKRSFDIDQREYYLSGIEKNAAFALNYSCAYVPFPLPTIGKVNSGLMTVTDFGVESAERIALLEGLTATDEDYANELAAICRQNGLTMEQLKPHMNAQFEASVRDNIRMKKAIAFVRANADVTVVDAPASKD